MKLHSNLGYTECTNWIVQFDLPFIDLHAKPLHGFCNLLACDRSEQAAALTGLCLKSHSHLFKLLAKLYSLFLLLLFTLKLCC
ncbi:hypothetical protein D3C80_1851620 [compost metagenome]